MLLEAVLQSDPANPEAHWYLALLERSRGHFDAAERHLRAFLASAGAERFEPWRASARRRLAALADERRLAREERARGALRWVPVATHHFRLRYDERLGAASPEFARVVARYLEDARAALERMLAVVPGEPLEVVLYARPAYLAAYRHRFGFPTVGFFDGRIHVSSSAHPAGELRALLFHEYAHALFRERTGGDRPFWLNEGIAERAEALARGLRGLGASERRRLARVVAAGEWIPLARLGPGFRGLAEPEARLAYLESKAAAAWLFEHGDAARVRGLLDRLGRAEPAGRALRASFGVDVAQLDAVLREGLRAELPASSAAGAQAR